MKMCRKMDRRRPPHTTRGPPHPTHPHPASQENLRIAQESSQQREKQDRRARLWLERSCEAARVQQLGKLLLYTRWRVQKERVQNEAARKIQKVARSYIGWRRTMEALSPPCIVGSWPLQCVFSD